MNTPVFEQPTRGADDFIVRIDRKSTRIPWRLIEITGVRSTRPVGFDDLTLPNQVPTELSIAPIAENPVFEKTFRSEIGPFKAGARFLTRYLSAEDCHRPTSFSGLGQISGFGGDIHLRIGASH